MMVVIFLLLWLGEHHAKSREPKDSIAATMVSLNSPHFRGTQRYEKKLALSPLNSGVELANLSPSGSADVSLCIAAFDHSWYS